MRNLLFVSHSAELNGAELWLLGTLRTLDRGKYRPLLIIPRPGPLAEAVRRLGIETQVVPMKWWLTEKKRVWRQPAAWVWNSRAVGKIAKTIGERHADLVFTNSAATFGGAKAAKRARVPHVWAIHEIVGGEHPFLHYVLGRRALADFIVQNSAKIIVNSEASRAALAENGKIAVIYNGVAADADGRGRPAVRREDLGFEKSDLVAGIVGKIYAGKGQREAVLAVSRLARTHPNLKLLIVGSPKDNRYYRRLLGLIKAEGLEGRVRFTGYWPDLDGLLKTIDAVVVASVVDSFGRTALEAMAAGVPVLAVRAGGLPEIVEHGRNGFLAESRDPEDLARVLDFIFRHPDKAREAAERGRQTVLEKFTLEAQARGVARVLEEVLGG